MTDVNGVEKMEPIYCDIGSACSTLSHTNRILTASIRTQYHDGCKGSNMCFEDFMQIIAAKDDPEITKWLKVCAVCKKTVHYQFPKGLLNEQQHKLIAEIYKPVVEKHNRDYLEGVAAIPQRELQEPEQDVLPGNNNVVVENPFIKYEAPRVDYDKEKTCLYYNGRVNAKLVSDMGLIAGDIVTIPNEKDELVSIVKMENESRSLVFRHKDVKAFQTATWRRDIYTMQGTSYFVNLETLSNLIKNSLGKKTFDDGWAVSTIKLIMNAYKDLPASHVTPLLKYIMLEQIELLMGAQLITDSYAYQLLGNLYDGKLTTDKKGIISEFFTSWKTKRFNNFKSKDDRSDLFNNHAEGTLLHSIFGVGENHPIYRKQKVIPPRRRQTDVVHEEEPKQPPSHDDSRSDTSSSHSSSDNEGQVKEAKNLDKPLVNMTEDDTSIQPNAPNNSKLVYVKKVVKSAFTKTKGAVKEMISGTANIANGVAKAVKTGFKNIFNKIKSTIKRKPASKEIPIIIELSNVNQQQTLLSNYTGLNSETIEIQLDNEEPEAQQVNMRAKSTLFESSGSRLSRP